MNLWMLAKKSVKDILCAAAGFNELEIEERHKQNMKKALITGIT